MKWTDIGARPTRLVAVCLLALLLGLWLVAGVQGAAADAVTLTRIDAQTAELCAPAGPVYERNGMGEYLQVIDAWRGGCGPIGVRDRFSGYVYCARVDGVMACSAPLAAWRGTVLYLAGVWR